VFFLTKAYNSSLCTLSSLQAAFSPPVLSIAPIPDEILEETKKIPLFSSLADYQPAFHCSKKLQQLKRSKKACKSAEFVTPNIPTAVLLQGLCSFPPRRKHMV